ncbi:hypothetical protein [Dyella sp. Tek66A03]|uniref:hypothetical protein n=1 Tax=Dyella sp. Tek66A03 TaxID=3458298 RepID=UPI00403E8D8D
MSEKPKQPAKLQSVPSTKRPGSSDAAPKRIIVHKNLTLQQIADLMQRTGVKPGSVRVRVKPHLVK